MLRQCRLLGLADSLVRFQGWPLIPSHREMTHHGPFLSHAGRPLYLPLLAAKSFGKGFDSQ